MLLLRSLALLCCFVTLATCRKSITYYFNSVRLCKRYDPKISECFAENFMKIVPMLKDGVEELNLATLEPAMVERITMDFSQSQSVKLVANLTEVMLYGVSGITVEKTEVTPSDDQLKIYLEMNIPHVKITSQYQGKGNFLLLAIDTTGNFTGEFDNLFIKGMWVGNKFMKRGKKHLKWTSEDVDMSIKRMEMHFSNIIPNNEQLNNEIDKTVNENLDSLYEEVKPVILETINSITLSFVNAVYDAYPYDVLYPLK